MKIVLDDRLFSDMLNKTEYNNIILKYSNFYKTKQK